MPKKYKKISADTYQLISEEKVEGEFSLLAIEKTRDYYENKFE